MEIQINKKEVQFKDIKPAEVFMYKGSVLIKLKTEYDSSVERKFNSIHLHNADTEYFYDSDVVIKVDHSLNVSL